MLSPSAALTPLARAREVGRGGSSAEGLDRALLQAALHRRWSSACTQQVSTNCVYQLPSLLAKAR